MKAYETAEQNPQQREESFFKLFHASSNPMAITTLKEGRIIDLNEAFTRFTGYLREELVSRTTEELGIWKDRTYRCQPLAGCNTG